MPATAIAAANRYFQPGTTKVIVIPSIASLTAGATRGEINAGTDVSGDVAAINGFQITSNQIDTPDLGGRFTKRVPGRLAADDSSITFYADVTGADIRTVLTRDLNTYIGLMDGGDVAGRKADYFQVRVASVGKVRDLEDAPRLTVTFTIRDYGENKTIPA
jgi:hypothetical protein